jgi:hypothetical protein
MVLPETAITASCLDIRCRADISLTCKTAFPILAHGAIRAALRPTEACGNNAPRPPGKGGPD